MAAVFPLDTTKPWVFNGVTYEYDATEDRWFVVSTTATDSVVSSLGELERGLDVTNSVIDQEIENRTVLLNAAASKNNSQDASIDELSGRIDAIGANVGILEFKGRYKYVLEKSAAACDAAYIACLNAADASDDPASERINCNRLYTDCVAAIGQPLEQGTFTSIGTIEQSLTEELLICNTDLDGLTFDWENLLETGDYIELVESTQNDTVLYEVVSDPIRDGNEERIRVKYIKETANGDGKFNLQEVSEVRVIKQKLGLDIVEADKRYVQRPYRVIFSSISPTEGQAEDTVLRNGELWYDTLNLELFVWNNNAWVAASKPPSQDIVVMDINAQVDALNAKAAGLEFDINALVQDRVRSPHLYYSDDEPTGNAEGNLIDGDLWVDSDDLTLKFYSQGQWINPDRTSDSNDQQLEAIRDSVFGRLFKLGGQSTQPRDYDGYCWFGSNYLYVSAADLDNGKFSIICDDFDDTTIRSGSTKHMITVCKKNSAGTWSLIATGNWPGVTDCRDAYIYIKDLVWTKKPAGWTTGGMYRIKISPFW